MITRKEKEKNLNDWFDFISVTVRKFTENLLVKIQNQRDSGKVIYPEQDNILEALKLVNPKNVKVVILGQDTYHEPNQATGLAFSVPNGTDFPPTLRNIFKELHCDIGCPIPTNGNLSSWAQQGVLLFNTVLTVEAHKANSHRYYGWQPLTSSVIAAVLKTSNPVVFLCWGRQAYQEVNRIIDCVKPSSNNHCIISSTHPSPLSANKATKNYSSFMGSKPFSRANHWLDSQGVEPVNWDLAGGSTERGNA